MRRSRILTAAAMTAAFVAGSLAAPAVAGGAWCRARCLVLCAGASRLARGAWRLRGNRRVQQPCRSRGDVAPQGQAVRLGRRLLQAAASLVQATDTAR